MYIKSLTQAERDEERFRCQQEAINAGALRPQGIKESMAASYLEYFGQSFADTPLAQHRLEAWTRECMRRKGFSA
jgi:hypothetical protein